jgi:hypothetical protein
MVTHLKENIFLTTGIEIKMRLNISFLLKIFTIDIGYSGGLLYRGRKKSGKSCVYNVMERPVAVFWKSLDRMDHGMRSGL